MTYVYTMGCGCTWASSFPRTRGSRVPWCRRWDHRGLFPQRTLTEGPFEETLRPGTVTMREHDGYSVTPVYTVWRRQKDGYVAASAGTPTNVGHPYKPDDGTAVRANGFETLLVTDDWDAAHARIVAERVGDEAA